MRYYAANMGYCVYSSVSKIVKMVSSHVLCHADSVCCGLAFSQITRAYSRAKRAGGHLRWLLFRRPPLPRAGRAEMVAFNGVRYRHAHNLQGDVLGLVDNAGNLMVEYRHRYMGVAGVGVHEA